MSLGKPTFTQFVYVEADGNDTTGEGSYENPYLTVAHAMAAITDATTTKRYQIVMGPMVDASNVVLRPYVWIQGADLDISRLSGTLSLHADWGIVTNQQAGFQNIIFAQAAPAFDFGSVSSQQGKLYFTTCRFNGTPVFTAFNAVNQIVLQDCYMFAGYTQNGINMSLINTSFVNAGAIALNSSIIDGVPTTLIALGGATDGDVVCTYTAGHTGNQIQVESIGFGILGALALDGTAITYQASCDGLPSSLVLSNGAPSPVFGGGVLVKTTDINVAGPYVVTATDYMLCVRYTATDIISIELPSIANAGNGRVIVSIDSGYNAATKNITLVRNGSDKINNVAGNYTQNVTGSAVWLKANTVTSNWEIV
jgi:hypothetical protein